MKITNRLSYKLIVPVDLYLPLTGFEILSGVNILKTQHKDYKSPIKKMAIANRH